MSRKNFLNTILNLLKARIKDSFNVVHDTLSETLRSDYKYFDSQFFNKKKFCIIPIFE